MDMEDVRLCLLGGFWRSCIIARVLLRAMVKGDVLSRSTWERDILNELLHFGIENLDVDIVLRSGHDECDLK